MRASVLALALAALLPPLLGNAAKLAADAKLASADTVGLALSASQVLLAAGAALAVRRLRAGALGHAGRWLRDVADLRVALLVLSAVALTVSWLGLPVVLALIAADLVFWTAVLIAGAPTAGAGLSRAAAVLFGVARTSTLGTLLLEGEVRDLFSLAHTMLAPLAALLITLAVLRLWRYRAAPADAPTV